MCYLLILLIATNKLSLSLSLSYDCCAGNSKETSLPVNFLYTPANVSNLYSVSAFLDGSKYTFNNLEPSNRYLCLFPTISVGYTKSSSKLACTAVNVRERGLARAKFARGTGRILLLPTKTTSLLENFFSNSLTNRCWILWNDFKYLYGTCMTTAVRLAIATSAAPQMKRFWRSAFNSWFVFSKS